MGTALTTEDREARLSSYCERLQDSGEPLRVHVVRHPVRTATAVADLLALPVLEAPLSGSRDGLVLQEALGRPAVAGLALGRTAACVLAVPAVPGDYSLGASRQTLRRKARAAARAGVTCRPVVDAEEQVALAARLDRVLPHKADSRYQQHGTDHRHMVGAAVWLVAEDRDGEPLVLAVAPVDGRWALLQCFISLGEGRAHSDARYLLTQALVEELSRRGARHLVDTRSPVRLSNGLRHFQRMVGFRVARVRLRLPAAVPLPGRTSAPAVLDRRAG